MKKVVRIDKRAAREIKKCDAFTQAKIQAAFEILARDGKLEEPLGKKITDLLFEIRIKQKEQWRVLYSYLGENLIIILSAFHKKNQKIPLKERSKAKGRLQEYRI